MSNSIIIAIILQLIGCVIILAEVIIPSAGILALLSIGCFGYSLYLVFSFSTTVGTIFVAVDTILIPVMIKVAFKFLANSPATLKKELSSKDGFTSQSSEYIEYLGKEGVVTSDLRPAGTALIDGKKIDVVSRGEYIEKSTEIVVIEVTGNQILVGKKS